MEKKNKLKSKDTEIDNQRVNAFDLWWKVTRRTQIRVKIIPRNYKLSTDSTRLSAGQFYVSLPNQMLSINGKQFCGHEGKGVYPLTCDSARSSISQVRSFRGHDPPVVPECPGWPWQDINTARARAQALATLGPARAHLTTEPGPGHTRKTRSYIMVGKTVAVVLLLLLISALGTQGKETLPKALLTDGWSKR